MMVSTGVVNPEVILSAVRGMVVQRSASATTLKRSRSKAAATQMIKEQSCYYLMRREDVSSLDLPVTTDDTRY